MKYLILAHSQPSPAHYNCKNSMRFSFKYAKKIPIARNMRSSGFQFSTEKSIVIVQYFEIIARNSANDLFNPYHLILLKSKQYFVLSLIY